MTSWKNQTIWVDVSPIKSGDFPASHVKIRLDVSTNFGFLDTFGPFKFMNRIDVVFRSSLSLQEYDLHPRQVYEILWCMSIWHIPSFLWVDYHVFCRAMFKTWGLTLPPKCWNERNKKGALLLVLSTSISDQPNLQGLLLWITNVSQMTQLEWQVRSHICLICHVSYNNEAFLDYFLEVPHLCPHIPFLVSDSSSRSVTCDFCCCILVF